MFKVNNKNTRIMSFIFLAMNIFYVNDFVNYVVNSCK